VPERQPEAELLTVEEPAAERLALPHMDTEPEAEPQTVVVTVGAAEPLTEPQGSTEAKAVRELAAEALLLAQKEAVTLGGLEAEGEAE
jgi:hypothetical protein